MCGMRIISLVLLVFALVILLIVFFFYMKTNDWNFKESFKDYVYDFINDGYDAVFETIIMGLLFIVSIILYCCSFSSSHIAFERNYWLGEVIEYKEKIESEESEKIEIDGVTYEVKSRFENEYKKAVKNFKYWDSKL